jgi:membrane associated rhomboid family serine protease
MKKTWRLSYDAPVTLTFSLICAFVLVLSLYFPNTKARSIISGLFTAPGSRGSAAAFNYKNGLDYFRLFLYVFGHADWSHLLGNLAFILLLGPLMEERYGSGILALMMAVTAFVASVINATLIPLPMHGASGIVFMLIMLIAITSFDKGQIPLSSILVMALYIGRELIGKPLDTNIAAYAHIAGGLCGSLFGFFVSPKRRAGSRAKERLEEIDGDSPRKTAPAKKSRTKTASKDETVIGNIRF